MATLLRMNRRPLLIAALCGALASLASPALAGASEPSASAARSCAPPDYPGSGYFTSLAVKRVTCAKGRKVALAHYRCRTENGRKGRCSRRVLRFSCSEQRTSIPTQFDSRVTCRRGAKRVTFTYQQNT
jgi:hypothetical protein